MKLIIEVTSEKHSQYAESICLMMAEAARQRGTGIAKRDPAYVRKKIAQGHAVIAMDTERNVVAGFCYIEIWDAKRYLANSGLIVHPNYRNLNLAKNIKARAFRLSRRLFPQAKLFGITTSLPVMKINSALGYRPVTFSELPKDESFWMGCQSCPNYDILLRNERKNCLCTGMLFDPAQPVERTERERLYNIRKYYRWVRLKQQRFLKYILKSTFIFL